MRIVVATTIAIVALGLGSACAHGSGSSDRPTTAPAEPAPPPVATVPPPSPPPPHHASPGPGSATPPEPPPPKPVPQRPGPFRCHLPAPKLSDDPCSADADCGVSAPCHAPACVAQSKSQPAGPDTMCTRMLACNSADANRCGCYQGRCALIPPGY